MKALSRVKNKVVKWGNGGIVYKRDGKIECYYLFSKTLGSVGGKISINTKPMDTRRLFDGPDCYHWRKTFAFWPVKTINNKYVWLRPIYKQRFWTEWGTGFHMEPTVEYAELFDILAEQQ